MSNDQNNPTDGEDGVIDAVAEAADGPVEGPVAQLDEMPAEDGVDGDEPPILERRDGTNANRHKRAVFGVPIQVVIAVGRANPSIGELMTMHRDTLLPLDTKIEDPVELIIGKRVIARGRAPGVGGRRRPFRRSPHRNRRPLRAILDDDVRRP